MAGELTDSLERIREHRNRRLVEVSPLGFEKEAERGEHLLARDRGSGRKPLEDLVVQLTERTRSQILMFLGLR